MVNNDEHLFLYLSPSVRLLWRNVFRSSAHFSVGLLLLFFFLILNCVICLYILEIKPFLVTSFAHIFMSIGFFFTFMVSFALLKLVSLISSHLLIFVISYFAHFAYFYWG